LDALLFDTPRGRALPRLIAMDLRRLRREGR
jgi:hypothetical protein